MNNEGQTSFLIFFGHSFLRPQEGVQVGGFLCSPRLRGGGCRRPAQPREPVRRSHPREARRPRPAPKSDEAYACCAATANRPVHLWTLAWRVAGRSRVGAARARASASRRRNVTVSAVSLPPTSSPTTTSLQRRAAKSSG